MEQGQGITGDSNFLCSEYDGRAYQAANETDSWERDHSYNTGNVTADGKYLEKEILLVLMGSKEDTFAEYSEQR